MIPNKVSPDYFSPEDLQQRASESPLTQYNPPVGHRTYGKLRDEKDVAPMSSTIGEPRQLSLPLRQFVHFLLINNSNFIQTCRVFRNLRDPLRDLIV